VLAQEYGLPNYQFHFEGNEADREIEPHVFRDLAAAKCEAAKTLGAIICDAGLGIWNERDWGITVTNEAGLTLFTLSVMASDAPSIRHHSYYNQVLPTV
jgi:hypothetical protein